MSTATADSGTDRKLFKDTNKLEIDRAAGEEPGDSLPSEQPDCDYIRPLQH